MVIVGEPNTERLKIMGSVRAYQGISGYFRVYQGIRVRVSMRARTTSQSNGGALGVVNIKCVVHISECQLHRRSAYQLVPTVF